MIYVVVPINTKRTIVITEEIAMILAFMLDFFTSGFGESS